MTGSDPQGHGKLIRIRPYRPSDSEQVLELIKAEIIDGPVQLMYKAGWKGPTTRVSYCIAVLGLVLTIFATNPRIRYIGITLFVASCALFAGFRYTFWYSISEMMKPILNDNLKDIGETFRMKPIISDRGRKTGEYVPSGKSGFWVAEAYEESSDIDDPRTEVIGCVGLYANNTSDKTSAELRRMVVSPKYRRRGIAVSLIKTVLQHARHQDITSIVLVTTMFQPAAIAMYEKFGWVREKNLGRKILLDKVWIFFYSLDLATVKV